MRPTKVDQEELMEGLMSVFTKKGYDGASLNDLAESSGLKKASLYHRFPGGKQEIANALLKHTDQWIDQNVFQILANEEIKPTIRLKKALSNTNDLYKKGADNCILRTMSTDNGLLLFQNELQGGMQKWIDGFFKLGIDLGIDKKEAKSRAYKTLILIQGSLVVSKNMADLKIFSDTMNQIRRMYE